MAHRALQLVSRGLAPPVAVGELIPETYVDSLGNEQPIDFERLVELGAAEKVQAKPAAEKSKPAAKPSAKKSKPAAKPSAKD